MCWCPCCPTASSQQLIATYCNGLICCMLFGGWCECLRITCVSIGLSPTVVAMICCASVSLTDVIWFHALVAFRHTGVSCLLACLRLMLISLSMQCKFWFWDRSWNMLKRQYALRIYFSRLHWHAGRLAGFGPDHALCCSRPRLDPSARGSWAQPHRGCEAALGRRGFSPHDRQWRPGPRWRRGAWTGYGVGASRFLPGFTCQPIEPGKIWIKIW